MTLDINVVYPSVHVLLVRYGVALASGCTKQGQAVLGSIVLPEASRRAQEP